MFSKKLIRILKKNIHGFEDLIAADPSQFQIPKDELILGLKAIDKSFDDNEIKLQQAERSLDLSSRELDQANRNLFDSNNALNTALNGLEEGLVIFDRNGLCSQISSAASARHFEFDFSNSGVYFFDLFKSNQEVLENVKNWIQLLFSGRFNFKTLKELGPDRVLHSLGLQIQLTYRPIYDVDGKLERILVISRDMTEENLAKDHAENQKNIAKTIVEMCKSPKAYLDTFELVQQLNLEIRSLNLQNKDNWSTDLEIRLKRLIHTIKGSAGIFNLKSTVGNLHNFETRLNELQEVDEKVQLIDEVADYVEVCCRDISVQYGTILKTLYVSQERVSLEFQERKKEFLSELIEFGDQKLIDSFRFNFELENFVDLFLGFEQQIQNLSHKLGKSINPIKFKTERIPIIRDAYRDFLGALSHVILNICDHGIEFPDERKQKGKSEFGLVTIECLKVSDRIILRISDDGQGINKEKLREKIKGTALEAKYNDSNILNCIFEPHFSTKSQVTEFSGRGVGMNVVQDEIKKMGGQVKIVSEQNIGTTFEFTLPILDQLEVQKSEVSTLNTLQNTNKKVS